jgi:geranylgeranyl reductase family protein
MGRQLELEWPKHPVYPQYGYVVRRRELDTMVARNAVAAGATVLEGHEALQPIVDRGFVRGAVVQPSIGEPLEIRARYVVVADGANSRFGRSLGTFRTREWPYGTAIRTYWDSPRTAEPWIESALDVKDRNGNPMPGYGWIFPVGDGRINVGVGLLSTSKQWKSVNTSHLMESFAAHAPASWDIRPETSCGPPTGGKLPMAFSLSPTIGPTHLVIGDAGGAINPFNGEGICYAYETGRMAAAAVSEALVTGDARALAAYPRQVQAEYELYYKVASAFVKIIGHPVLMRSLVSTGMRSRTLMEWILRIMANLLRPDELGPAEAAYKAVAAIARLAPGPSPALRAG